VDEDVLAYLVTTLKRLTLFLDPQARTIRRMSPIIGCMSWIMSFMRHLVIGIVTTLKRLTLFLDPQARTIRRMTPMYSLHAFTRTGIEYSTCRCRQVSSPRSCDSHYSSTLRHAPPPFDSYTGHVMWKDARFWGA
jgi:hypothetical protein